MSEIVLKEPNNFNKSHTLSKIARTLSKNATELGTAGKDCPPEGLGRYLIATELVTSDGFVPPGKKFNFIDSVRDGAWR